MEVAKAVPAYRSAAQIATRSYSELGVHPDCIDLRIDLHAFAVFESGQRRSRQACYDFTAAGRRLFLSRQGSECGPFVDQDVKAHISTRALFWWCGWSSQTCSPLPQQSKNNEGRNQNHKHYHNHYQHVHRLKQSFTHWLPLRSHKFQPEECASQAWSHAA